MDARESLANERDYHRANQWRILELASKILIGITGGVAALAATKEFSVPCAMRWILGSVVVAATTYAWFWWNYNYRLEKELNAVIKAIDNKHGIPNVVPASRRIGFGIAIASLGLAALLAICVAP